MKTLGYYNGEYDEIDRMRIPMTDRVCTFGDGVYEATSSRNYKIFALDEHVERFYNSAALLDMNIPCTKEELKAVLYEMLQKMDCGEQFVYWQLTRGTHPRSHTFDPDMKGNLWIMLNPFEIKGMSDRYHAITMEDTRFLHCNIKTLNLIPSVMAAQKAKLGGCQETILHRGDIVTECSHSNVHILKDGVLITHPTDRYILPGIARAHLIRMCKNFNISVDERPFTLQELMDADEILVTSSSTICRLVDTVDGKSVGGKDTVTAEKLQMALKEEYDRETVPF